MKMFRILMFVFLCIFLLKPVQVEAKLEAPKNPIAICKNSHSIKLKWNKCNDADGYKIYRYSASKKRFIKVKNINKNISKWTDKSLKKHKVYYYKIASYQKGKNKNKNSKKTYKICARTYGKKGKIVNALSVYAELNTGKSIGICSEGKIKATVLGSTNTKQNRTKVATTKTTIEKINGKKINPKKQFKLYVEAYKMIDGKKEVIAKSNIAHLVGKKNKKYTNVKSIKGVKKEYTVELGKTTNITAKVKLVDKKKKHIPKSHCAKFRYKSSDGTIARVDKNGQIKGNKKGTCTIYVYSVNGNMKKATVTVK